MYVCMYIRMHITATQRKKWFEEGLSHPPNNM